MQLHFTPDAAEEPLELYHKLKLYGEDDPGGQASIKKPVSLFDLAALSQENVLQTCYLHSMARTAFHALLLTLSCPTHLPIHCHNNQCWHNIMHSMSCIRFIADMSSSPAGFAAHLCRLFLQVMSETYEEMVFSEPAEAFYERVTNHNPTAAPQMSQSQWFTAFNAQDDLRKISSARQRVAGMTASVQRQLESA